MEELQHLGLLHVTGELEMTYLHCAALNSSLKELRIHCVNKCYRLFALIQPFSPLGQTSSHFRQ